MIVSTRTRLRYERTAALRTLLKIDYGYDGLEHHIEAFVTMLNWDWVNAHFGVMSWVPLFGADPNPKKRRGPKASPFSIWMVYRSRPDWDDDDSAQRLARRPLCQAVKR